MSPVHPFHLQTAVYLGLVQSSSISLDMILSVILTWRQ